MNTQRLIVSDTNGSKIGELIFYEQDDHITIARVEVALAYRRQGYAGKLMRQIVGKARAEGKKLNPECAYAAYWLETHPEHGDLISDKNTWKSGEDGDALRC